MKKQNHKIRFEYPVARKSQIKATAIKDTYPTVLGFRYKPTKAPSEKRIYSSSP